MNLGKITEITKKVTFLKNYSSLLMPIVIIVVGIFLFIPVQLMSSGLKKQIEKESASVGRKIKSLSGGTVSREQWKVEEEYQKAFASEANQTSVIMKQSSERELLSYKLFPELKDTSTLIFKEFGQLYCSGIDNFLVNINAHDCPTEVEIARSLQKSSLTGGSDSSQQATRLSEVEATIVDALCKSRARSASVYINATDLAGYSFWSNYEYIGMDQAIRDCWYWQLGYWIIEDVLHTVGEFNSGTTSVFESPVKRLLYVNFTTRSRSEANRNDVMPKYITSSKEILFLPHTARISNEGMDIVQFEFSVIIRADEIVPFIKKLCSSKEHKFSGFNKELPEAPYKHNQISILGLDVEAFDVQDATHKFYRYGDDAIVQLTLSCEYIFGKSSYDAIKPTVIKQGGETKSE